MPRARHQGPGPNRKTKRRALLGVIPLVFALAACGTKGAVGVSATAGTTSGTTAGTLAGSAGSEPGYLYASNSAALFLQETIVGSQVSGTLSETEIDQSNPAQLDTNSGAVTGTAQGGQLTLHVGFLSSLSGTISDGTISLAVPNAQGGLNQVVLHAADAGAFNQAVATLQGEANQSRAAQQAAAQQAGRQEAATQAAQKAAAAQQSADNRLAQDAQAVASDIQSLAGAESALSGDEAALTTGLATGANDVAQALADLHVVQKEGASSLGCEGDVGTVEGDAGTVQGDQGAIEGDTGSIDADITTLQNDLSNLQTDAASLASATQADPSYTPSGGVPGNGAISGAEQGATAALKAASSTAKAAAATAQSQVNQANAYASQASAVCSG